MLRNGLSNSRARGYVIITVVIIFDEQGMRVKLSYSHCTREFRNFFLVTLPHKRYVNRKYFAKITWYLTLRRIQHTRQSTRRMTHVQPPKETFSRTRLSHHARVVYFHVTAKNTKKFKQKKGLQRRAIV